MQGQELLERIITGRVNPKIYAFETKTVPAYLKVGDTYRPVRMRLKEWEEHYEGIEQRYEHLAMVSDDTYYRDHAVHKYLLEHGFYRAEKKDLGEGVYYSSEFFKDVIEKDLDQATEDIQKSFDNQKNDYTFYNVEDRLPVAEFEYKRDAPWQPRKNQEQVIEKFLDARNNGRTNLLMYAVMRFGKTFTSLCCAQRMGARLVVVVSGKTAVKEEWKENVERPILFDGYKFLSVEGLERNPNAISDLLKEGYKVVLFLTLQDLLGDDIKERHRDLFSHNEKGDIDLLIIDESHFAARSEETGKVLKGLKAQDTNRELRDYDESLDDLKEPVKMFKPKTKLHLSGTPYRILLDGEFKEEDIIAKVQYVDIVEEQKRWYAEHLTEDEWKNPYYGFPEMIRFAFNLNQSSMKRLEELRDEGIDYRLNALLRPLSLNKDQDGNYKRFKYEKEVLDLLLAIDGKERDENIFSFLDYPKIQEGNMCRHIVMVLPFRASCDAMEALIKTHDFRHLGEYQIINISGVNLSSRYESGNPQYVSNIKADIERLEGEGKKTITLTVGKMLTGSTVKQWDTMIFLKGASSPQEYDQAIYRLQSQYVRTIKSEDGKDSVVYDMKPQTLLVDFDPTRMFVMQNRKSLIAKINSSIKGNEELERRLKRELEFSPIIWLNHNKLHEVKANDIIDAVREYSRNKSIMDETFDIPVDDNVFNDEVLKALIEQEPEMNGSGNIFKADPYKKNGKGDNIDIDDAKNGKNANNTSSKTNNVNDELKSLRKKLRTYYFKTLLFAFLSDLDEKTLSDVIQHAESNEHGKRIAHHLSMDISVLIRIRDTINPNILHIWEEKINNIDTLSNDNEADCLTAMKRFSRLSDSEVTTPVWVAEEMVTALPPSINSKSKILNIAGKIGEFEYALCKRFGKSIAKCIYTLPTSGLTYECTRKMFKLLDLPVCNIFDGFTTYDLIYSEDKVQLLKKLKDMNFNAVVGNPPYQEQTIGTSDKPIYHLFIDAAYTISPKSILITPARFLFNAGKTPNVWNKKMLDDKNMKVIWYRPNSSEVFSGLSVNGGVTITIHDLEQDFGRIGFFTVYPSLNTILSKVNIVEEKQSLSSIVYLQSKFNLEALLADYPNYKEVIGSNGRERRLTTSIFKQLGVFNAERTDIEDVKIIGLYNNNRTARFIPMKYLDPNQPNLNKWKVIVAKADGAAGQLGKPIPARIMGKPEICEPNTGFTQSFVSIGAFDTRNEAVSVEKYMKTQFARLMLSVLKVTQDMNKDVWFYVPIQDFTSNSDIDWSKPIEGIDEQLFTKYGLNDTERQFIRDNIKPME